MSSGLCQKRTEVGIWTPSLVIADAEGVVNISAGMNTASLSTYGAAIRRHPARWSLTLHVRGETLAWVGADLQLAAAWYAAAKMSSAVAAESCLEPINPPGTLRKHLFSYLTCQIANGVIFLHGMA